MRKVALILVAVAGGLLALNFTKIGLSRLTVRVTIETNNTFSIVGIPVDNPKAQMRVLRVMTTVGVTNVVMTGTTMRDIQSAREVRHTLTNAGFQSVGLSMTSRQIPP